MFTNYGSLLAASICLRHGLVARKSFKLSHHIKLQSFRPEVNKICRNYCTTSNDNAKIVDRPFSNEILEILESPDKIERDHKYYRSELLPIVSGNCFLFLFFQS